MCRMSKTKRNAMYSQHLYIGICPTAYQENYDAFYGYVRDLNLTLIEITYGDQQDHANQRHFYVLGEQRRDIIFKFSKSGEILKI